MGQTLSEPVVEKVREIFRLLNVCGDVHASTLSLSHSPGVHLFESSKDCKFFHGTIANVYWPRYPTMVKTIELPSASPLCKVGVLAWKMLTQQF